MNGRWDTKTGRARLFLPLALLILATLACAVVNPTPVAWSRTATPLPPTATTAGGATNTPIPLPSVTAYPTPEVAVQAVTPGETEPAPAPTVTPAPPSGPWLVALGADRRSLLAVLPEGGEPVKVDLPAPVAFPADLQAGASPAGGWLALRTGSGDLSDLALVLVHLPDGAVETVTPLLSEGLRQQMAQPGPGETPDPFRAVTRPDALAWSPDGHTLAFIGAAEGPAADLYLLDAQTRQVRRMTGALYQAASPHWSPDGLWVVFQQLLGIGSGTGWRSLAVYATGADHNELRKLYTPPANSAGEVILGWREASVFVAYTQAPDTSRNARLVPVSGRAGELLYAGPFAEAAYDPASGVLAFYEDAGTGRELGLEQGLYLASGPKAEAQNARYGEWSGLAWSPSAGRFLAHGPQGMLWLTPQGEVTLRPGEGECTQSPDRNWLVCWGEAAPGARLYRPGGDLLQEITPDAVQQVTWRPDSKGIYYTAGGVLFRAFFPDLRPTQVSPEALGEALAWVGK